MLDLNAIRQRAATRANAATPANPANWLMPADPASQPISQLATLATLASEKQATALAVALAAAINRCCDARGDDDANRAALLQECAGQSPEHQADLLAHFTIEAARLTAISKGVA